MARSWRIDVPDGWYQVFNREVERRQILPDEQSNLHFLELLRCLPSRFGVRIHGYVLMGNHYHLQIQTPEAQSEPGDKDRSGALEKAQGNSEEIEY